MSKIVTLITMIFFMLVSVKLCASNSEKITVHHGKYSDYYHIKYTLIKNNFLMSKTPMLDNGQFEIYLSKDTFPVSANNCQGPLILRMPSTLSDSPGYSESIQKKKSVYDEIKNIDENKKESLDVFIELNPYVIIKSKKPLTLELENCNVFFRTKNYHYVDTLQ